MALATDAQSHDQEQLHRPEALLRKAWLTLSPADWIRRQRLDAAREHRLPAEFSTCSTLEGPSCLSSTEKPVSIAWGGLEDFIADRDAEKPRQQPLVKLLLIKPKLGDSLKQAVHDVLQEQAATSSSLSADRVGSLAQAAELAEKVLSQHGQTVYEGDPSVPPDMDAIMATIASAIGIEPEGSAADAMKKELVRALTDSEFAAHSAQDANDDDSASAAAAARVIDAFFDTSAQDSDKDAATPALNPQPPILGPPSPPVQASGAPAQAPSAAPGGQPTATAASEQTRRSLHQAASAPSQRVGKRRSESAESAPDAAENRQAGPAARRHAGLRPETQRSKQAAGYPEAQPSGSSVSAASAQKEAFDTALRLEDDYDMHPDDIGKRVYSDETGKTYILDDPLPGDELLPSGERVYYDDYGTRFIVDDDKRRVRKDDVQLTPLSDDMAWLDGLSDEEYDAYWDEVEREEAAMAAEEEERKSRKEKQLLY